MILDLKEKVSLPKNVFKMACRFLRFFILASHQMLIQLTSETTGKPNQTLRVAGQKLFRNPRLSIKPMQRSFTGQSHQVPIPLFILGNNQKMVIPAREFEMIFSL